MALIHRKLQRCFAVFFIFFQKLFYKSLIEAKKKENKEEAIRPIDAINKKFTMERIVL
jgi:hypothetical protein